MERIIKQIEFPVPEQPKALRVAAYARVSSGKDAMLHSLSAQVSYYSNLIQNHKGWLYCGVYSDEAFTGTKENREGFQNLLTDCRAGKIDMVITKSISRFARNTVTLLETVRELKLLGVDVFFEEQNIHTMSADGELMMTILASYAQEESLSASENQKWRVRECFKRGEVINLRFLFGYRVIDDELVIEPDEAEIVKEIFYRAVSGDSLTSIAKDLNSRGIHCALGGKWSAWRVRATLENEKYTGNALLQKTFVNNHLEKKKCKNRGELPQYYVEDMHEAIIDDETFTKAQQILQHMSESNSDRTPRHNSAFTGMIRCGNCGHNFRRCTGAVRCFWNCPIYINEGKEFCHSKQVPEETLYKVTAEVLGLAEFDEAVFRRKIDHIVAEKNNTLVFHFRDGTVIPKQWEDRSRAESWTPEMKEKARQKALEQRRKK